MERKHSTLCISAFTKIEWHGRNIAGRYWIRWDIPQAHLSARTDLTAIGRDPNNQIYPIAWAVVDSESNDNWQWFIHRLKIDFGLGMGDLVTIISDQHKGLIHGVAVELPRAEHRACARHIYSNLKKNHKSDTLKPLFWRIASSYNEGDYERSLDVFKKFDPLAAEDLMKKDRSTWCRAFFRIGSCCSDTHNNFTDLSIGP